MRGGEAFIVAKAISPPRAPPLRPRKLLQVVEMCSGTGGAMDATVLDMKRCADLFVCPQFSDQALTSGRPHENSTFRSKHPAQR